MLDGKYWTRDDAIQKCADCANSKGFEIFAISRNGECLSSESALGNYMLHGPSTNCNDEGTGGDLKKLRSMDVYRIVQGKEADDIIQDCFPKSYQDYKEIQ